MTQHEIDQEMKRAIKENPQLTPMELVLYHMHLQGKLKKPKVSQKVGRKK